MRMPVMQLGMRCKKWGEGSQHDRPIPCWYIAGTNMCGAEDACTNKASEALESTDMKGSKAGGRSKAAAPSSVPGSHGVCMGATAEETAAKSAAKEARNAAKTERNKHRRSYDVHAPSTCPAYATKSIVGHRFGMEDTFTVMPDVLAVPNGWVRGIKLDQLPEQPSCAGASKAEAVAIDQEMPESVDLGNDRSVAVVYGIDLWIYSGLTHITVRGETITMLRHAAGPSIVCP